VYRKREQRPRRDGGSGKREKSRDGGVLASACIRSREPRPRAINDPPSSPSGWIGKQWVLSASSVSSVQLSRAETTRSLVAKFN